jgi:hypothetical protein
MYTNFMYIVAFIRHVPKFLYHTFFVAFWQSWKISKIAVYGKIMRDYYRDLSIIERREEAIKKLYSIDEDRMLQIRQNIEEATDANIWRCSPNLHSHHNAPVVSTPTNPEVCKVEARVPTPYITK